VACYTTPMFDITTIIETGGILGIAIIVFLESCLLPFLPGDSLLFTAGFLASQGFLPIIPLYISILVAAILGDNFGYFLGRRYGNALFSKPDSFFFTPKHVEKTEIFFKKYGPKAVIIARFLPVVRALIPVSAGIGRMEYKKFFLYNVIGGFLWTTSMLMGGYYLSRVIPNSEQYIHEIILGIIIVSFMPAIYTFVKEKYSKKNAVK
jgi:membrane-associated protein